MASAGLPTLPGAPPFGGEILSHDFVEAAFLRRAGWGVWLVPELGGSYEQLPPTLSDFVNRDRRWCQGNLQHLRLLNTKGLRPASRAHLLTGAMAYLASPLWLTLLLLTSLEAARAALIPWDYFADATSFGPAWPIARRAELLGLFAATLGILMLPRFLALLHTLVVPARRAFGGAAAVIRSVFAELAFSILLAPILMVQHTRSSSPPSWDGASRGAASSVAAAPRTGAARCSATAAAHCSGRSGAGRSTSPLRTCCPGSAPCSPVCFWPCRWSSSRVAPIWVWRRSRVAGS